MKRKLTSLFAIMFIVFVSVFASACGDKYKDMTFRVYYAFSENATEWYDGTNGISLNYNPDDVVAGDPTSLIFNQDGVATLYVRVEIENVKAKHVDSISVTSATVNGLSFSSDRVEQGQVFTISISSNVSTMIKLYENNSGRQAELPFVVSRELTEIVADTSLKPAMATNGSLNLLRLNNLQYLPLHQTNQIGVNYSVYSIGYYDATGTFSHRVSATGADDYIAIENGILRIKDGRFYSGTQHIIKVKATSTYHDGLKDANDEISAYFDVYVVENSVSNPVVKFDDVNNEEIISQINIYENGGKYATSTVEVDTNALESIYKGTGLRTGVEDEYAKFSIVVYVKNELNEFVKYDFADAKFKEGINGLIVTDEGNGKYTLSVGDRNVTRNTIRFAYEIEGLDFSASQSISANKDLTVVKGVMPTCITVNDSVDLTSDSDPQNAIITSNSKGGSLTLKLAANPNDNVSRTISLINAEGGLTISNSNGAVSGDILSGSTISIKFKDGVMTQQTLVIKTLNAPTYYNEKNITSEVINNNSNYIVATYNITKLVTADSFAFVESVTATDSTNEVFINAISNSNLLVKVYYTGVSLDPQTITIRSDNEKVLFANNSTEISLRDVTYMSGDTDANGKYSLYAIPVKATNSAVSANISIVAGDGSLGVEQSAKVSSVYLMDNPSGINVNAKSSNIKEFDVSEVNNKSFNFAISKGDFGEFTVVDAENTTRTISKIELSTIDVEKDGFSTSAINYNVISNSVFAINGRIGGKTQVINLKVYYYALDAGVVCEKDVSKSVQIAVYDGIGMINVSKTQDTIGYVNLYYTEASSTDVSFDSYTSNYATPASSVVFNNDAGIVSVDKASQIQVDINNYLTIKNSGLVEISFISGGTTINLIENNGKILTLTDDVFLRGTIHVELNGEVGNLSEISFALKALNFGLSSNTITNVTIKVATVDGAKAILVSGDDFVETSDTSSELQFSFMSVANGGYDEKSFNASLQFAESEEGENKLRFENIETALTHVLYRYELDANGNFKYDANNQIVKTRIQDDFFDVTYSNGVVTVKAYKNLGGGLFKLVLATKDSYNLKTNPTSMTLEEEHFDQTFDITIRVSDGSKQAAFIIKTADDLKSINNNLDKHFTLQSHLDISNSSYDPIGLINGSVNPFTGSLNGQFTTLIGDSQTKVSAYSITLTVEKLAYSPVYGNLAGLFAVIGDGCVVENLNITVKFASSFTSAATEGLKVGALAGVNNGKINNVQVEIINNNSSLDFTGVTAGDVTFGGIVGLNNSEVVNSRTEMNNQIYVVSGAKVTHNIGLIAGVNSNLGTITGAYVGKESLNNFVYDVIVNISVQNTAINGTSTYYVGGAVGANQGSVNGILIGGSILMTTVEHGVETGVVGGVVANSSGSANSVTLCTALALDINVKETNLDVGGVVGYANESTVDTVKFVSVQVKNNGFDTNGTIIGKAFVGGVVAKATAGTINYASVESFIDIVEDEIGGGTTKFYPITGGGSGTTAGLVASTSGTNVDNSFVNANISSSGKIILTVDVNANTYFIGTVSRALSATDVNETFYSVVDVAGMLTIKLGANVKEIDWSSIMVENTSISAGTTDWTDIYTKDANGNYVKAESYVNDNIYYTFNSANRNAFTTAWSLTSPWEVKEYYNVVNIKGIDFFFPYLIRSYDHDNDVGTVDEQEPLLIVAPQSIVASINEGYIVDYNAVYVREFNIEEYVNKITESVVVNFYDRATEEDNAHNIITYKDKDGKVVEGLLDVTILPEDAQGGYDYEIVGDGYKFAYINSKNQIVFTSVSGQTPILVKIYSVFNPEIEVYVIFYSQSLLSKLTLSSSSIYYSNETDYDYEINTYTGQNNKIIAFDADNVKDGNNNSSIFDNRATSQYLKVEISSIKRVGKTEEVLDVTTGFNNSLLEINTSRYDNVTVKIEEDADIDSDYVEIITFTLKLDKSYFGGFATEDISIANVKLLVRLYNSATSIDVDGTDSEITTNDDYSFSVRLVTDYINEGIYFNDTTIEKVKINSNGEFYIDVENSDAIRIALEVVEGQDVIDELIQTNSVNYFAELFNISILTSLYKTENDLKVIGYIYNVMLELKDEHDYRYITDNIKFNIIVTSTSNPDVTNKNDGGISILLKPAVLSTARIENYVVTSLNVNTDYTNIVTNNDVETSIVEPGSLGNVMMIYLEPTYSQVVSASIKTSELYVPSLGKNVKMKFTQLVHDQRKGKTGIFTTLYDGDSTIQVDDTLELKLISSIDASGKRIYNGVICVYIQLEGFSGLEATITAELNVETSNGKTLTRTRELLTTYLPGTKIEYNEERRIGTTNKVNEYLIQKGTSENEARIKIHGYQFNSNPTITFAWSLPTDSEGNVIGNYTYDVRTIIDPDGKSTTIENRQVIIDSTTGEKLLIGNYVSVYMLDEYDEVTYNATDDSYTIALKINVSAKIMAPFTLSATLSLTTKDGQLKTSSADDNTIKFYPTEYILNSVYVNNLANNRKNIAIGKSSRLDLMFTTDNEVNDLSSTIFDDLITWANGDLTKIENAFAYYKNGQRVTFVDEHPEFEFNFINGTTMTISGVEKFNNLIELTLWYGYEDADNDGIYEIRFGQNAGDKLSSSLVFTFTLNIYTVNDENEILIYSAEDVFNASSGSWELIEGANYVLVNDIELENVTPITTAIGRLDGNNKVISIKSFKVDDSTSDYGLFAKIGTYTTEDPDTEQSVIRQTILKNVIVDYGNFDGTIALNNNSTSSITFGGLVAKNEGGLIYNCDVMNLNVSQDAAIDVVVSANTSVVFGGLVGVNSGIITNSRVGRDNYTKITATKTTESSTTVNAGGLTFSVFNKETAGDDINQFSIIAGGFAGQNSGTISTSYIANTNLINYSANEATNITAGFVGQNTGEISYSYAKADESTITTTNPYSTGYVIDNKGNGIVAGFVYTNSGSIHNSYANIELQTKSAYISGFVYNNTGEISESYAATTMNAGNIDSNAEQPFVGVDSAGNLLSTGKLENTYYLMRSATDNPLKQGNLDYARGLNETNFQNSEYLVGFSFILSNAKVEREQGLWSYYTIDNKKRILPELMNANVISHSYRYVVDEDSAIKVLRNAATYAEGSANNPYTISNVEEYNKVFTENEHNSKFSGYVRFINNINFDNDETAIQTRANYTLGETTTSTKTSVEGNGMTISGIYLDVGEAIVEKIGLFAEIKNAYVKNLNLEFATPTTDGQFSTTTATYSGGLAGKIENSVIMNVNLAGSNTTLTGKNFVGGLAGMISGTSLIYSIETNLNIKASSTENYLYYNQKDYEALNVQASTYCDYSSYLNKLSYAGGVAGVLDLTTRSNAEYNVQFIDVRGDLMNAKTFDGKQEANILAEYAGGIAGYASNQTESYRLRYFTGDNEIIRGDSAVGGLYGVALGGITASQVTTEEETQYEYDTNFGKYIIGLQDDQSSTLDKTKVGNLALLESYKYAGGLVGVGLNANIRASYSKVGIKSGEDIGGLIGLSVSSVINYSYSIPYINFYEGMQNVGGLVGSAYGVTSISPARNSAIANYEALLKYKGIKNQSTDIQFTYSTLILDNDIIEDISEINETRTNDTKIVLDYVSADYREGQNIYLQSNSNTNLTYVYAGTVNYYKKSDDDLIVLNQTRNTSKSAIVELYRLYNVGNPDQTIAFQEVFSGWSIIKYWSLNEEKYFPLLTNEGVDNFIDIDDENDLIMLETNPTGNFRVINDIIIPVKTANWIVRREFQGVLLGELESDSRRPMITVQGLTPTTSNTTTGFFESTHNATISNLEFVWTYSSSSKTSIDLSRVDHVTLVSGLTCDDEGSLISNVEVRVTHELGNTDDGYILNNNSGKTIEGFGGLVGKSINTNILSATFAGKINATLASDKEGVYVGGIVAKSAPPPSGFEGGAEDSEETSSNKSAVINNTLVGVQGEMGNTGSKTKYPTTKFELKVANTNTTNVFIGGVVGHADTVAIASSSVGGTTYSNDYQHVEMIITLDDLSKNISVGGIAGQAAEGMILSSEVLTNITIVGKTKESSSGFIEVGGLAGDYSMVAQSLTSGISKTNVQSFIKTVSDGAWLDTKLSSHSVMLSTGVATLRGVATLKQGYISGEVNTEGADIKTLYVGGAVANVDSGESSNVDIEEIITNSKLYAGTVEDADKLGTSQLYAGGLIGNMDRIDISYSASWGRIVPITSQNATDIYVGGLVGKITELSTVINNSYTISSIVADSIANSIIDKLYIGALVGKIPDSATSTQIVFSQVFYSSDYALFADENYLDGDIQLGKNISAQLMLNDNNKEWIADLQTEGEPNTIWHAFSVNGKARLPYLTSLEEVLSNYSVITRDDTTGYNDYVSGSAMRPITILSDTGESNYTFQSGYNYYLLTLSSGRIIPTFSGVLEGILFGQDLSIDETFIVETLGTVPNGFTPEIDATYSGIIPVVAKHSAVSNLNVIIDTDVSSNNVYGIIAGFNNGLIFNSSVQGDGIEFENSGSAGLIAGKNNGLISYCYSSAEIKKAIGALGGIVNTNAGKLLSNYFTGYIEGSTAAGILVAFEGNSYVYNNYMAGVIKASGANAFSATALRDDGGSNNFMDIYSDYKYYSNPTNDVVKSATTYELMSRSELDGEWYSTVSSGILITDTTIAPTFSVNYNYPVYRFNKLMGGVVNDWKNQLYTGTGIIDAREDPNEDGNFTLAERYSTLTGQKTNADGSTSCYNNYTDAFKIPHLGVLTSVQSLLNSDRNYVLIYDIDGEYKTDTYISWTSIGTTGDPINGFVNTNKTEGSKEEGNLPADGFNGVFVSNKYYSYTLPDKDNIDHCVIENLSNEGLFNNIGEAYIGSISLGSFHNMKNSGPLGVQISSVGNVTVNNIVYKVDSIVSGSSEEGSEYFGGLFGLVDNLLTVGKFISSDDNMPAVNLSSNSSTVGLIAGKIEGNAIITLSDAESTYFAWFHGNEYAGGVVGNMAGGEIITNDNEINLVQTNVRGKPTTDNYTKYLGGIVGTSSGGKINNTNVCMFYAGAAGASEIIYLANSFGGIVANVTGEVNVGKFILNSSSKTLIFEFNAVNNTYYGLLAGNSNGGSLTIDSFGLTKEKVVETFEVRAKTGITTELDENKDDSGVGLFVGKSTGELSVDSYIPIEIAVEALDTSNVGGFVGCFAGSKFEVSMTDLAAGKTQPIITVSGSVNIGGLFGYCKTTITDSFSLINSSNAFATIMVEAGAKNIGGLFGRWDGSNGTSDVAGEYKYTSISSRNEINVGYIENNKDTLMAYNVGGIAGKIASENIGNLVNNTTFTYVSSYYNDTEIKITEKENSIRLINVGGIAGYVHSESSALISGVTNKGNVVGYQNVGGLVGYAIGPVSIINSESVKFNEVEEGELPITEIGYDGTNLQNATIPTLGDYEEDADNRINKGSVYGVVNVGGVVGYAGENVSVEQIYTTTNVYGNTNVGGIAGFSNGANMKNNYIHSFTSEDVDNYTDPGVAALSEPDVDIETYGVVKAIFFNYEKAKKVGASTIYEDNYYIPTSVGGVVGTSVKTKFNNNILNGVQVVSSLESEGVTIDTIKNNMSTVIIGSGNNLDSFISPQTIYKVDETVLMYNDIQSGFGGFVGTIDQKSINEGISNNYLSKIKINAQLGANVGTFYGVYKRDNEGDEISFPEIYGEVAVDASYNVGGLIGYVCSDSAFNKGLNNRQIQGNATIKLQEEMTGMYVGGLIGKTNMNTITGLSLESGKNVNVQIYTNNSYYIGGLIGRAEVTENANISGNLGTATQTAGEDTTDDPEDDEWTITNDNVVVGDKATNFGGLIGMLKSGYKTNGLTLTVKGYHNQAFTVNTVENSNYFEGDSYFSYDDKEEVNLYATAKYINKDTFIIQGSNDTTLYSNNLTDTTLKDGTVDKADVNPLNTNAHGWSKEYTGFRQLQRNIPQTENNDASWDAIIVLYDAAQITHVGTIGNLGLHGQSLPYANGQQKTFDDDYICFTVYEQSPGQAILYSAMGIAKLAYNYDYSYNEQGQTVDKDGNVIDPPTYLTPKDNEANVGEWVLGFIATEHPSETFYIHCNNNSSLKGLTYFTWMNNDGTWCNYTTIGGQSKPYQHQEAGKVKNYMSYFVSGYLAGDTEMAGDAGPSGNGAYFIFDVVYQNTSLRQVVKDGDDNIVSNQSIGDDSYLSPNGSIFYVAGVYSQDAHNLRQNEDSEDEFGKFAFWTMLIIEVVITVVTLGSGAGISASSGFIAGGFKMAASAVGRQIVANWAKYAGSKMMKWLGRAIMVTLLYGAYQYFFNQQVQQSIIVYNNYVQPSTQTYGYLSTSYIRDIYYNKQISSDGSSSISLAGATDYMYQNQKTGAPYVFVSSQRPADYYTEKYTCIQLNGSISSSVNANDGLNVTASGFGDQYKPFGSGDFDKVYINSNLTVDGETSLDVMIGVKGSEYWLIEYTFEIKHGVYYKNGNLATIKLNRAVLNFEPQQYGSDPITGLGGERGTEPTFVTSDGSVYVHGTWNGSEYKYANWKWNEEEEEWNWEFDYSYSGNNLTFNGSTYALNSKAIGEDIAVHSDTNIYYQPFSGEKGPADIEGYNYFETAYYTKNGTSGIKNNEKELVKYAYFKREATRPTDGVNGIDYYVGSYKVVEQRYRKATNTEILDSDIIKYKNVNGNYVSIAKGEAVPVDEQYVMYDHDTYKTCYYVLEDEPFLETKPAMEAAAEGYIWQAVYPSTFVNPYDSSQYPTIYNSDSVKTDCKWMSSNETDTIGTLLWKPTYYIYEGGYVVDELELANNVEYPSVYVPNNTEYSLDDEISYKVITNIDKILSGAETEFEFDEIGVQTKKLGAIIADWENPAEDTDYSSPYYYYIVTIGKTYQSGTETNVAWTPVNKLLCESFYVKGSNLYLIKENYTINDQGLLAKQCVDMGYSGNVYQNMYLHDAVFEFYARYKYSEGGTMKNLTNISGWADYNILPDNSSNITINYGRPTTFVECVAVVLGGVENQKIYLGYGSDISGGDIGSVQII